MAGKHDAYVFNDAGTYKVRPGVVFAVAGTSISIRNLIKTGRVDFAFPTGLMQTGTPTTIPAGKSQTFTIDKAADGFYAYQITFVLKSGRKRKCHGESDPGMIVDP